MSTHSRPFDTFWITVGRLTVMALVISIAITCYEIFICRSGGLTYLPSLSAPAISQKSFDNSVGLAKVWEEIGKRPPHPDTVVQWSSPIAWSHCTSVAGYDMTEALWCMHVKR